MAVQLGEDEFQALVEEQLDTVPEELLERLDNVIFLIEDHPEDGSDTLGWYDGFSLEERHTYGYGEAPDRIVLFRENLCELCKTVDELREEIRTTLVHEIAHFLGFGEERIHELGWG